MSFLDLFVSQQQKVIADAATPPPATTTTTTINLCSACLDIMMKSAICNTCSNPNSRTCILHAKKISDPALTPSYLVNEKLKQGFDNGIIPVQFKLIERSARRSTYTDQDLENEKLYATVSPSGDSSSAKKDRDDADNERAGIVDNTDGTCQACRGLLHNINHTTHQLARSIRDSPFKDSYEIAICTMVAPILCCHWDTIYALFVECCFKLSLGTNPHLVNCFLNVSSSSSSSSSSSDKAEKASASAISSWKGTIQEDFLQGGLRANVVNDVRNFSLDSCLPPPSFALTKKDRWTYMTHGSGNGIICEIQFHNDEIMEKELKQIETKGLLQHDGSEATWERLYREVAPHAYDLILSSTSTHRIHNHQSSSSLSIPQIEVRHEPLFFYGRYRKFSRTMSQSPWFANNGQRVSKELSLQEEIANRVLHIFFPGVKSLEDLNIDAARNDTRLYTGRKNLEKQQQQAGTASSGGNSHVSTAKQEARDLRGSKNASSSSVLLPQRREREEDQKQKDLLDDTNDNNYENNDENDENEDNDQSPAGKLGVMRHARPMFNNVFGFSLYRFHAGGREDVDVRMLGNGRPFVIEVINPHKQIFTQQELNEVAENISKTSESIEVDSLAVVGRGVMLQLQEDAEGKKKAYRCVCFTQKPLPSSKQEQSALFTKIKSQLPITLNQRTPTRVLHRRANLVRNRKIYAIDIEVLNQHWMVVDLMTQAGTYVKEFCHGDLGRTTPNLSTLLDSPFTDIVQLDVQRLIHSSRSNMVKNDDGMVVVVTKSGEGDDDVDDDDDDEVDAGSDNDDM